MSRAPIAAVAAAFAMVSGSAAACEFHEMMAYGYGGYGAPQRYSPFARAEPAPAEPAAQSADRPADEPDQAAAVSRADPSQQEQDANDRRREGEGGDSTRTESLLAQRR